ncbi:excisionase family DNA binding protein [Bosea sp. BE125]|uniref:helix-turn-helix domain-containing protein n=1 Tax=Bosea sp. BE125 TaxID=2817909 RepID=UPI002860E8AC|nr:helix-turn-helix domain-containing protein [Bosea sp. BE125]MDR6870112.1 excisionase family DNA binding protein [Bosea sp. BE125]
MSDLSQRAALTAKELRSYVGISEATVYRLVASGRLPSVKIGRRTLFRRADVDALLSLGAATQLSTSSIFD